MQNVLLQYGLPGAVIVGLAGFVMYLIREHKKERKEWVAMLEKMVEKLDTREKETNFTIREVSNILTGLKTLFEVHLRKEK